MKINNIDNQHFCLKHYDYCIILLSYLTNCYTHKHDLFPFHVEITETVVQIHNHFK